LQGYGVGSSGANTNEIPVVDGSGNVIIAAASPSLRSSSGTFKIDAQTLYLTTASNGSINLDPHGTGNINLTSDTTTGNAINATASALTTGTLIYGGANNSNTGFKLLQLQAGSTLSDKFTVDASGKTYIAGNLGIGTTSPTELFSVGGSSQFQVNSLGRVVAGTWQGTAIGTQYGGTGQNWSTVAQGSLPYFSGTGAMDTLAPGTTGYLLQTNGTGANPSWIPTASVGENYWTLVGTDLYPDLASYNVGIGTTSPSQKLDVVGNLNVSGTGIFGSAKISGALFDKDYEAGNSGQVLKSTGSAIDWVDITSIGIGGSGTINYLPKFTAATTLGNSLIYDSGTNIGIGTTGNKNKLDINGSLAVGSYAGTYSAPSDGLIVSGNVGIGTTSPLAKLNLVLDDTPSTSFGFLATHTTGGVELITNAVNRDFSGAGNWTGTNWSISTGAFLHSAGIGNTASAVLANANLTSGSIISSRKYTVSFTVSGWTAGSVTPKIGTVAGSAVSSNTTSNQTITAAADDTDLAFTPTENFDGSIDDISVKRIDSAFVIANNGSVGIGTTSITDIQNYALYVNGDTYFNGGTTIVQDLRLNGNQILNADGTATILLSSTPTTTWSTLDAGAWKVYNTANLGQAALAVIQDMGGDIFTASSSGQTRLVIKNDGNVGIGTTSPQNKLDVYGGLAIGSYAGSSTAPSNGAIISGNVGIGTTNPREKLEVNGNLLVDYELGIGVIPAYTLDVYGDGSNFWNNDAYHEIFIGGSTRSGAGLLFDDYDFYITNYELAANGDIFFRVGDTSATVMTIKGSGNVGIGTTGPQNKLDVSGALALGSYAGLYTAPSNGAIISGNVGIGTTSPGTKLQVAGTVTATDFECTTCIDQGDLKATYGTVSSTVTAPVLLPGGNYGFYPLVYEPAGGNCGFQQLEGDPSAWQGTYVPLITIDVNAGTCYARQYYVQASPPYFVDGYQIKHFIYFLWDKASDQIVRGYEAEDPPFHKPGEHDISLDSHPFPDYAAKSLPENMEIVFVDPETIETWKAEAETKNMLLLEYLQMYYQIDPLDHPVPISPTTGQPITLDEEITWRRIVKRATPLTYPDTSASAVEDSADIAEYYDGAPDLEAGDIVSADKSKSVFLTKSSKAYEPSLLGVISTSPSETIGNEEIGSNKLTLIGRVPVKVSTINGTISNADHITASAIPGVGMRATKAGETVGKALEAFDPATTPEKIIPCPEGTDSGVVCGRVITFLNISWYDPDVYLSSVGDIFISSPDATYSGLTANESFETQSSKLRAQSYNIKLPTGETVERLANFAEAAIARVKAGLIETTNLIAENILVEKKLVAPLVETGELTADGAVLTRVSSDFISPLSGNDLVIDLTKSTVNSEQGTVNEGFGKLIVKGDAEFSGNVGIGQTLEAKDASISGELYAESARIKKLRAESIEGLEAIFATMSANYITSTGNIYNNSDNISGLEEQVAPLSGDLNLTDSMIATDSSQLEEIASSWSITNPSDDVKIESNVSILGVTTLAQTIVSGPLTQDGTLLIDNGNSINVLAGTLYLQNQGGGIDLLAGKVIIDPTGNAVFEGNLTVKATLFAGLVKPLNGGDLTIDLSRSATDSSQPANVGFGRLLARGANGETVFSLDASGSAQFSGELAVASFKIARDAVAAEPDTHGIIEATASAGLAKIPAASHEVTIRSPYINERSLIYLTPIGSTENQVLYLARTNPTGQTFTAAIDKVVLTKDILFSWWIVN
jgi:hypothetical protein